ncbi:MAG TPA: ribosome maturation factor RimM [Chitinophagaceae bacterium]|nr:ribosome maturation factor RimM [Chitinophagaceae bacterium]
MPTAIKEADVLCQVADLKEGLKAKAVVKDNIFRQQAERSNPESSLVPVFKPGLFYFLYPSRKLMSDRDRRTLPIFARMPEYFKIGKLVAVHGLKGELLLKHELGKKTSLKGLQAIFIEEKKKSFLPWFIEATKIKSEEETYIKIEGLDTRESAMKLSQKKVWLPETDFKKFAAKSAPASLLGYIIINDNEALGEILELIEQPHQLLCRLEIKGKEVLIPLHEDSLEKIDHKKKEVRVILPDGLLEIYLS